MAYLLHNATCTPKQKTVLPNSFKSQYFCLHVKALVPLQIDRLAWKLLFLKPRQQYSGRKALDSLTNNRECQIKALKLEALLIVLVTMSKDVVTEGRIEAYPSDKGHNEQSSYLHLIVIQNRRSGIIADHYISGALHYFLGHIDLLQKPELAMVACTTGNNIWW